MWFIDVLLLCYLLYFVITKLGKQSSVYVGLCITMVMIGWVCLEHSPRLPFLWTFDGRGYATFFLGERAGKAAEAPHRISGIIYGRFFLIPLCCRI